MQTNAQKKAELLSERHLGRVYSRVTSAKEFYDAVHKIVADIDAQPPVDAAPATPDTVECCGRPAFCEAPCFHRRRGAA